MNDDFVKWLVEWCSEHGCAESRLLTPDPRHLVDTFELLDAVAEKAGVPKEQIGAWFNAEQLVLLRGTQMTLLLFTLAGCCFGAAFQWSVE